MCYDLTFTNIQMQCKRCESGSPLFPHTPGHEVPSSLFMSALTLTGACVEPAQLANPAEN